MTTPIYKKSEGWIAIDFDGTLSLYDRFISLEHCGAPIPAMMDLLKKFVAEGREVRIFTARAWPEGSEDHKIATKAIQDWLASHGAPRLAVTCVKDPHMDELYDDRAIQVERNTGKLIGYSTRRAWHE